MSDDIAADLRHKDVMAAFAALKADVDRLAAQLTELSAAIEVRGKLIDRIAEGLGIAP